MPATLGELEYALVQAGRAGDQDAARKLAAAVTAARGDRSNEVPGMPAALPGQPSDTKPPSLVDKAIGTGEAALSTVTGATTGAVGFAAGTVKGIVEQVAAGKLGTQEAVQAIEKEAVKGMQAGTYTPRTQSGQEQTAVVGDALQNLVPLAGIPGEAAALANAAKPAVAQAVAGIKTGATPIIQAVTRQGEASPGTPASVGAAGVDAATLRQAKANELPVPLPLTEGMKTRSFEAQRFERETAKDPALGGPIRERFADLNRGLIQNMDSFIDASGSEAPDLRSIGIRVNEALRSRAAKDKTKIRTLYKEAEKAGEMEAPVSLDTVVAHLNESAPEAEVANILKAARAKAIQLGVAAEDSNGALVANPVPLKTVELFRRSINNSTNAEPTNIRQASILKGLVDEATDTLGGDLYQKAREARTRYAKDYENVSLVRNILGQKKGSTDRAIALEDVLDRSIISPTASLDDVRQIRKLLQTEGGNGWQAWKELQGGTLTHIKEQATRNVARNERGDPVVSAAQLDRVISALDKTGKLDFIFGKKGAEQLRTLNEVAKDVLTSPPGAVNTSHTASVLLAAMDMAISGMAGVPAPVMSGVHQIAKSIKNAKTRARVNRSLGIDPKLKSVPNKPTLH